MLLTIWYILGLFSAILSYGLFYGYLDKVDVEKLEGLRKHLFDFIPPIKGTEQAISAIVGVWSFLTPIVSTVLVYWFTERGRYGPKYKA